MKKEIAIAAFCVITLSISAQTYKSAYKFSNEPLDLSPSQTVYKSDVEICDKKSGEGSYMCVFKQMRHDAMNYNMQPYAIKRGGISIGKDNSSVRVGGSSRAVARRQAEAQRKARRDQERADFFEQRRQERLAAARRARRVAIEKERRRRAEDNQRAVQRSAQVYNQLQGVTNERIASDYWHAGEGKALAKQAARQAMGAPKGMVITQQTTRKTSGEDIASNMRTNRQRQRQRRPQAGGMEYYSRRPMPPVVREPLTLAGQYVFTGRATKTQIHIKKDDRVIFTGTTSGPSLARGGQQFRLSPHATVTTGQDWHTPVLKDLNKRVPSRPVEITPSRARTAKEMAEFWAEMLPEN